MKVDKKNEEHLILSQWIEVIIMFLAVFTLIISMKTIKDCFDTNRDLDEIKYLYDIKNNIDYKVYMFENNFFEEEYLGMNKQYMSKLVDTINVDFSNKVKISKKSNIEYNYEIKASINAKAPSTDGIFDSILWTKNYVLKDNVEDAKSGVVENNIYVPLEIDFQEYKQLVTEFQNQMRLDINAYFNVDFILNYVMYIDGERIVKTENLNMQIPLSTQTFSITTNYSVETNEVVYQEIENDNNIKLISGFILFFSSLSCGVILLLILIKDTKRTEYIIQLNKIIKNYGDVIAAISNLPSIEDREIYEMKSFADLINIEEELKIPIIYYEKKANKEGWFLILHNEKVYRYILKEKRQNKKI